MNETKVVRNRSAILLGIVCIFLAVSIVVVYLYQNSIINDQNLQYQAYVEFHAHDNTAYSSLQSQYANYQSSHSHNDSDYNSLQSNYTNYVPSHNYTNSDYNSVSSQLASANSQISNIETGLADNETALANANAQITSLNSQVASLNAPKLINVNLVGSDNRTLLQNASLLVSGYVCNVGSNSAYNSRIHVLAYQNSVVAIDTYITLGTILGSGWTSINQPVNYNGSALTNWTLALVWST